MKPKFITVFDRTGNGIYIAVEQIAIIIPDPAGGIRIVLKTSPDSVFFDARTIADFKKYLSEYCDFV